MPSISLRLRLERPNLELRKCHHMLLGTWVAYDNYNPAIIAHKQKITMNPDLRTESNERNGVLAKQSSELL